MDLEKAGVKYNHKGITISKTLQTSNSDIYAVGDCVEGPKFTHASGSDARLVLRNALFMGSADRSKVPMPYCTYTVPEVAKVGMNEQELQANGIKYDVYAKSFGHNDRAICDSKHGLYKVYCKAGTDTILGATLVGGPAGDLISMITSAMQNNTGLNAMGGIVHPYPTYVEAFKAMADDYNRTRLKPMVKSVIRKVFF